MNSYQQGFLAGLTQEYKNPYRSIVTDFTDGEQSKLSGLRFSQSDWTRTSLSFRDGYKADEFPHLACNGKRIKRSYEEWEQGFKSGSHKFNGTYDNTVHCVDFVVEVVTPKKSTQHYPKFTQKYTYLDHRNEVYLVEACWRYDLRKETHPINETPKLPSGICEKDIFNELGELTSLYVFDPCQSSHQTYRKQFIKGIAFRVKNFGRGFVKAALEISEWNQELKSGGGH